MKQNVNDNVALMKHVEFVRRLMDGKDWKQADLARSAGVSTGVISRFFGDGGISQLNLFKILSALGLLNMDNQVDHNDCPLLGCDQKTKDLCKEVKAVMDSKSHWAGSLEANIHSFKKGLDNDNELIIMKKRLENLEKVNSKGPSSGTGKKAASRTGLKKKAG